MIYINILDIGKALNRATEFMHTSILNKCIHIIYILHAKCVSPIWISSAGDKGSQQDLFCAECYLSMIVPFVLDWMILEFVDVNPEI